MLANLSAGMYISDLDEEDDDDGDRLVLLCWPAEKEGNWTGGLVLFGGSGF